MHIIYICIKRYGKNFCFWLNIYWYSMISFSPTIFPAKRHCRLTAFYTSVNGCWIKSFVIHLNETVLPHHNHLYLFFLVSLATSFPSHSAAMLRNRMAPYREYFDELKWKTALPRCQGAVPMVLSELYPSRKLLHSHFRLRKRFGWHFA